MNHPTSSPVPSSSPSTHYNALLALAPIIPTTRSIQLPTQKLGREQPILAAYLGPNILVKKVQMSAQYPHHVRQRRRRASRLQHIARHESVRQRPIRNGKDQPLDLLIGHASTQHVEHGRYDALREEWLPEEGAAHGQEGDLNAEEEEVLGGAESAFEGASVFEEVVGVHEPSYGGRAEEARRREGTP
eukprot:CAMPEP_0196207376 /NCGR_PEP_ID=MMETSP0912-20130531/8377_1 /TAXON_ID=49265 /ORGANISM="Thalassiosira rotula, Strain GSO102" /LENGTH=187 /DNA_ID=CAMNT_0041482031 /DNA_START=214 /DNA_END=778 /DNA_ORIENTATION=-